MKPAAPVTTTVRRTGVAAGAVAQNLSESQFGIASKRPRWNLSGTYQQVLPRYFSTDAGGGDVREFLADCYPSMEALLSAQFRKGYEWPFDVQKIPGHGSSCVDLLVYYESVVRGRRVAPIQPVRPITNRMFQMEGSKKAITARIRKKVGKQSMISTKRMMAASTQPP